METFNDIIKGNIPVLVDFYANWCTPCKVMSPIIDTLGKEMMGKARILKIDIDKNQAIANVLNVKSVPTFIIFKEGKTVWRHSGAVNKELLLKQMEIAAKE